MQAPVFISRSADRGKPGERDPAPSAPLAFERRARDIELLAPGAIEPGKLQIERGKRFATTPATTRRANHLWPAGTTHHGESAVAVCRIMS